MKGATVLKFAAGGLAVAMILATLSYWILHIFGIGVPNVEYAAGDMSAGSSLAPTEAISNMISSLLFVCTMIFIAQLASIYEKGDFFTRKSLICLRRVTLSFFLYAFASLLIPYIDQLVGLALDGTRDANLFIVIDLPKIGIVLVAGSLFGLTRLLELASNAIQETKQFL